MSERKKFTCVAKSVEIEIDDKVFTIREFSGDVRSTWLGQMAKRVKLDSKGQQVGTPDIKGAQSSLITLCLFDEDSIAVPGKTIETFPASLEKELFEMCQEINGLNPEAVEAEKKE